MEPEIENMKKFILAILICLCAVILSACKKSDDTAGIIRPVTAFYDAIVTQSRDKVGAITCAEWEKDALRDVDSFMGVKSEMKDFSCTVAEKSDDSAVVTCKGAIAASYGAEVRDFPLDGRSHKVIKEQGEWRICGY